MLVSELVLSLLAWCVAGVGEHLMQHGLVKLVSVEREKTFTLNTLLMYVNLMFF